MADENPALNQLDDDIPADATTVPLDTAWCERHGLSDVHHVELLDDAGMGVIVTFNDGTQRRSHYPEPYPAS